MRTRVSTGVAGLMFLIAGSTVGVAGGYPTRHVQIITPAPAGNGPDVIARLVSDRLARMWHQQVVIINRPGGSGIVAGEAAAAAPADGYTFFFALSSTMVVLPESHLKLPFDLKRDFVPIGTVAQQPMIIAANPSLGVGALPELIALAKKRPGELLYTAASRGSLPNMAGEMLRDRTGIDMQYIPAPSTAQAVSDVMAGRISVVVESLSGLKGAIENGSIKPLAVASASRLPNLPTLPTVSETVPGFAANGWFVLMARSGTPEDIVQKVNRDLREALSDPQLQERFQTLGTYALPLPTQETSEFVEREQALWRPMVREMAKSQ